MILYSLFSVSCFFTFLISGLASLFFVILKPSLFCSVVLTSDFKDFFKGLFLIAWLLSSGEVNASYAEFGVDSSLSKMIGGLITLVYLLIGIAVSGIVYSEISKTFKNG